MDELRAEITPDSLRRLLGKSSRFDRVQKAALRKNLRAAAEETRRAVQAAARGQGETRARRPQRSRGIRAAIASGTRVSVLAGNSRAGVQLVTRAPLARAWTARKGWRHPVGGDRDVWVRQVGRPGYFADTVWARRNVTRRAVERAMQETLEQIGD